jgi:hypothetical protein
VYSIFVVAAGKCNATSLASNVSALVQRLHKCDLAFWANTTRKSCQHQHNGEHTVLDCWGMLLWEDGEVLLCNLSWTVCESVSIGPNHSCVCILVDMFWVLCCCGRMEIFTQRFELDSLLVRLYVYQAQMYLETGEYLLCQMWPHAWTSNMEVPRYSCHPLGRVATITTCCRQLDPDLVCQVAYQTPHWNQLHLPEV